MYVILCVHLKSGRALLFASKYRGTQASYPYRILVNFCQERLIIPEHTKIL